MSAASIAAEVEGVGGQPVSAQTKHHTLHQITFKDDAQERPQTVCWRQAD